MSERKRLHKVLIDFLRGEGEEAALTDDLWADLPKRWERHGDLVLFPASCFALPLWKRLDQRQLWRCVAGAFKASRVAKQGAIRSDDYRSPAVVLLLGDDAQVTHVDNGIRYSFDVTKCMFSSGNVTEKLRMARLRCAGEVVVDLFAGVGYFTLPLLVHAGAALVHACEWNPDAVRALRRNCALNGVAERCVVHEGDNREVAPASVADRVVLGLIPSASASYRVACRALKPRSGGWMHVHGNVTSAKQVAKWEAPDRGGEFATTCNRKMRREWRVWAERTAADVALLLRDVSGSDVMRWRVEVVHVERVKSYAPHVDHLVADLLCRPDPV